MDIQIQNCNNIDLANITLQKNKLNIKFAPNGTGKSTIAKAIRLVVEEKSSLNELMPFKLQCQNPNGLKPEINGIENIKSIMYFDEKYVNKFVFKEDELISNSFDIFIKTDKYKKNEQAIENLVTEIKQLFSNNKELESLIFILKQMSDAFKLTKFGISQSSTGMKAFSRGNNLQHIDNDLNAYQPFIQCNNPVAWIDWQTKGYEFTELSDNCPFCTSNAVDKKEMIKKVGEKYDKNIIKNLIAITDVIKSLGEYFSDDTMSKLSIITQQKDGLEQDHITFLRTTKEHIDNFVDKLIKLKTLSSFQFKEDEKVGEKLFEYKLDLTFCDTLNSGKTQTIIQPINSSLEKIIAKASLLQGEINKQRDEINENIKKHKKNINEFLCYAGYRYQVEIVGEGEHLQLKLRHIDHTYHISGGTQHLSFGEKNAFAIVLFMYECLFKKPDLIILDDPISSFDKNKKYAILEMLFRRKSGSCLINQTVLMLTHDIEPIIDSIKVLSDQFNNQTSASFLKLTKGKITELEIQKYDIKTFSEICKGILNSTKDDVIKVIYLRRHYEILEEKGTPYQILSNLLKKRDTLIDYRKAKDENNIDSDQLEEGTVEICKYLQTFSYENFIEKVKDSNKIKLLYNSSSNGYEKLNLVRLLIEDINTINSVVRKFINETYHIENEFICQLDPTEFDIIPEYIIDECDKIVSELT